MAVGNPVLDRETKKLNKPERPRLYNVVLHNSEEPPMAVVTKVLCEVFTKSAQTAEALMLQAHRNGQSVVETTTLDIAQTKVDKAMALAAKERTHGRYGSKPVELKFSIDPE